MKRIRSALAFALQIQSYLDSIKDLQYPTWSGLAVYLESTRKELNSILDNSQHKYHKHTTNAMTKIESILEALLLNPGPKNVNGIMFALKQTPFNWSDKQIFEIKEKRIVEIVGQMDREERREYNETGKLPVRLNIN